MIFERNYFLWASWGAWIFNIYLSSLWNQFWHIGTPWRSPLFLYREEKVGDDLDGSPENMQEIIIHQKLVTKSYAPGASDSFFFSIVHIESTRKDYG